MSEKTLGHRHDVCSHCDRALTFSRGCDHDAHISVFRIAKLAARRDAELEFLWLAERRGAAIFAIVIKFSAADEIEMRDGRQMAAACDSPRRRENERLCYTRRSRAARARAQSADSPKHDDRGGGGRRCRSPHQNGRSPAAPPPR